MDSYIHFRFLRLDPHFFHLVSRKVIGYLVVSVDKLDYEVGGSELSSVYPVGSGPPAVVESG